MSPSLHFFQSIVGIILGKNIKKGSFSGKKSIFQCFSVLFDDALSFLYILGERVYPSGKGQIKSCPRDSGSYIYDSLYIK